MIHFDLPKEQSSIIKVIGVGGGGSNAVNHMFSQNIEGVNFIICNTDAQAIALSKVPNKIQLGPHLTQGLGAGANPSIGRQATQESLEEIKRILEVNTKMAFITAGMGGGTGTGGAPIIASICKDLGILTVGIVTTPFAYEGKKRIAQAAEGIEQLKKHVDTLLIISNDKLRHQFGNLKMKEAFDKADNVLATAAKCITDVINTTGQINVDFADVCTVMSGGGVAILGSAAAHGENRAQEAIEKALASPLLDDSDIRGAKWILININSANGDHEFTMDEVEIIQNHLLAQAGEDTDVILGLGYDDSLGDEIGITLIATGFHTQDPNTKEFRSIKNKGEEKIVVELQMPAAPATPIIKKEAPVVLEEKAVEPVAEETTNAPAEQEPAAIVSFEMDESLMPRLSEHATAPAMPAPVAEDKPVFYEISSASDQIPVTKLDIDEVPIHFQQAPVQPVAAVVKEESFSEPAKEAIPTVNKSAQPAGFLVKPVQIYVEERQEEAAAKPEAAPVVNTTEEKPAFQLNIQEEEPVISFEVIVKDSVSLEQETSLEEPAPTMLSEMEEGGLQDETEEVLRKRAADRIAKLRNLSFNINSSDPNNEFETVPAYLRRNMEVHNQIADVETFYSNYTVKSTENNQAEISTINTFLEGKKPD